ncbi:apicoplast ribosomal protein S2, putative (apicoplast) [Plasmodium relictum]|uniref:Apicoplast ribosomal protein S2, putative n=1 Tax=Plasmodium relictum TaxID=85471 RepID=A0A1J1HBY7_PLARL|nr:apicoplast ribosomal protein S2, putative [Plasmodium relictum]CRH02964.1 apicoplast ribosomal protein S2, putative [Plasmodium relictum]
MFITFKDLLKSKIYIGNNINNIHINNYKFIYKIKYNNCILNFTLIAIYLYKLYLYIYNIFFINKKILFINNNNLISNFIIKICNLTKNYYINKWIPGLLTNWYIFKKKIIIFLWLHIILNNKYFINILSRKCINILNIIYNKLYLKFIGIKFMFNLPRYIFLTNYTNNLILKEILKLKLILISFINLSLDSSNINIKILGNYNNYNSLKLIYKIIYTSIIHSKIKNM